MIKRITCTHSTTGICYFHYQCSIIEKNYIHIDSYTNTQEDNLTVNNDIFFKIQKIFNTSKNITYDQIINIKNINIEKTYYGYDLIYNNIILGTFDNQNKFLYKRLIISNENKYFDYMEKVMKC